MFDLVADKALLTTLDLEPVRAVLRRLVEARELAAAVDKDRWEFAVEIATLTPLDVSHSQIRWLIAENLVEAQVETTSDAARRRTFRKLHSLALPDRTCLLLTDRGQQAIAAMQRVREPVSNEGVCGDGCASGDSTNVRVDSVRPSWDPHRRQLTFRGQTVKIYRVPAPNQEAVLAAFERSGWPHCVVDPLPSDFEQVPKQRLLNTIRALNRCQSRPTLRFRGDGTGRRVCWSVDLKRNRRVIPESYSNRTLSEPEESS